VWEKKIENIKVPELQQKLHSHERTVVKKELGCLETTYRSDEL
jgi:hypothetical protein